MHTNNVRRVSMIGGLVGMLLAAGLAVGAEQFPGDGRTETPLRYHTRADGTIRDDNTLLIWEKKNANTGIHDYRRGFTWSLNGMDPDGSVFTDFLDTLNNKCDLDERTACNQNSDCGSGMCGYAGHRDWRLPNVKELQSIVDYSKSNPASAPIFGTRFTVLSYYWSSTVDASDSGYVFVVGFNGGDVIDSLVTDGHHVRAVRVDRPAAQSN